MGGGTGSGFAPRDDSDNRIKEEYKINEKVALTGRKVLSLYKKIAKNSPFSLYYYLLSTYEKESPNSHFSYASHRDAPLGFSSFPWNGEVFNLNILGRSIIAIDKPRAYYEFFRDLFKQEPMEGGFCLNDDKEFLEYKHDWFDITKRRRYGYYDAERVIIMPSKLETKVTIFSKSRKRIAKIKQAVDEVFCG